MSDPIRLEPEEKKCPKCQSRLTVRNTRTRTIVTSYGDRGVTVVTKRCPVHRGVVFRPQIQLTSPRSMYSFDMVVEIGRLRFLEHKQIGEIRKHFRRKSISIPLKTVENLCQRFLWYCVAVHLESFPRLAELFEKQGGYVLHVDSTTTKGSPGTLLMKDGWSGIRLLAASISGESADQVIPHLKCLRSWVRKPVVIIRDMGSGMEAAILKVFPGVYAISCHFHVLRDIGGRLFDTVYPRFQRRVDQTGIKKRLRVLRRQFLKRVLSEETDIAVGFLEHLLGYKKDGNGVAYPFSLSAVDFYRRCEEIQPKVCRMILERAKDNRCSPCLSRLRDALDLLRPPPAVNGRIHREYLKILERWKWFEQVRRALRYRNGPVPLDTKGCLSDTELENGRRMIDDLQKRIALFVAEGDAGADRSLKQILRGISKLLADRREELFVPNVIVEINGKQQVRRLPRTNNALEQDFRKMRRHARRIRGDGDVERTVQKDGVGYAIVANLEIEEYVRCVYGGLDQMVGRFAKVAMGSLEGAKALFRR